ncbi:MAG TPA: 30S ribosomal protein S8 [Rickettsiales bacterium]|nr:30S ribosomal protein S8 [Rickettsiales bacterium]
MAINDLLSDMITRIRNGQKARLAHVECHYSKLCANVLEVLKNDGYIRDYAVVEDGNKKDIRVDLKYHEGEPVIKEISRESTPGRRLYSSISDLPKFFNGLGIAIVSTSKGVMSDFEARSANVGGEVLCSVF